VSEAVGKPTEGPWRETVKVIAQALVIALGCCGLRVFSVVGLPAVYSASPRVSMKETLLVGDYLFVLEGYPTATAATHFPGPSSPSEGRIFGSEPKRGDVVVFKLPRDKLHRLHQAGDRPARRSHRGARRHRIDQRPGRTADAGGRVCRPGGEQAEATLRGGAPQWVKHYVLHWERQGDLDNAGAFDVPPGHYFMMVRQPGRLHRQPGSCLAAWRGVCAGGEPGRRASIIFFSAATDDPRASISRVRGRGRSTSGGAGFSPYPVAQTQRGDRKGGLSKASTFRAPRSLSAPAHPSPCGRPGPRPRRPCAGPPPSDWQADAQTRPAPLLVDRPFGPGD